MDEKEKTKRRIHIREHVYKRDGRIDQIEFNFIDDFESITSIERHYSLWLTREHYYRTLMRRYSGNLTMPTFEEYIDTLRPLIAGHCCPEHDLRRAFTIFDYDRNGIITLRELYRLVSIIGRSTTEDKLAHYVECVNPTGDRNLDYEQFKQFARLGYGREMLVRVSMDE